MLDCRACLWRCLRALNHGVPLNYPRYLRRNVVLANPYRQQKLSFQTSASTSHPRALAPRKPEGNRYSEGKDAYPKSTQAQGLRKRAENTLKNEDSAGSKQLVTRVLKGVRRDPNMSISDYKNRLNELKYLRDPLELAEFVRRELRKGKDKEMLDLVRLASRNLDCVVSWNHMLDARLLKGQVATSLKLYNEMKKRGQFPDSYTYLLLLRGLANNAHATNALGHGLSIYHSMSAQNSRVEPAIIHTNAVLKVCARANDMDALWGVASKIPEKGPNAANNLTFTTILNAMRQHILVNRPTGDTDEELSRRKEQTIIEARRIWEDIIGKWRAADLIIDEELVCSMGRLLLLGSRPRDWDDVLSLVEQTMNIARLVPRLGTGARKEEGYKDLRAPQVLEQFRDDREVPRAGGRGDEFLPVTIKRIGGAKSLSYAQPNNNVLSVIQEACLKIVAPKAAKAYFDLLTDPSTYSVKADIDNLHIRLRMLRQTRSSAEALETLQHDFADNKLKPRPATFRIAMSTCVRDKNNHNAIMHATKILEIMTQTLEDADGKAVSMYIDLLLTSPHSKDNSQIMVAALQILEPIVKSLRMQLTPLGSGGHAVGERKQEILTALRSVYGAYDRLLNERLVAEKERNYWMDLRRRLGAYLNRMAYQASQGRARAKEESAEGEASRKGDLPPAKAVTPYLKEDTVRRVKGGKWDRPAADPTKRRGSKYNEKVDQGEERKPTSQFRSDGTGPHFTREGRISSSASGREVSVAVPNVKAADQNRKESSKVFGVSLGR